MLLANASGRAGVFFSITDILESELESGEGSEASFFFYDNGDSSSAPQTCFPSPRNLTESASTYICLSPRVYVEGMPEREKEKAGYASLCVV